MNNLALFGSERTAGKYRCGTADEAAGPGRGHYKKHRNDGSEPCSKSRAEASWAVAETKAGHPLPDYRYQPKNREGYRCGTADERETASRRHYWHHQDKGTKPCGKSLAEQNWANAETKAGRPLPDWEPYKPVFYECGDDLEDASEPGQGHRAYHIYREEEPCLKSVAEARWADAEQRHGPIPDWRPGWRKRPPVAYQCGTEPERPGKGHLAWHRRKSTEPCPKSKAESNWATAEKKAGRPLPDWKPWKPGMPRPASRKYEYRCGGFDDRQTANVNHKAQHIREGSEVCAAAEAESLWRAAEYRVGHPIPDWERTDRNNGLATYQCGDEADATEPGLRHYNAHYHRRENPCGKSLFMKAWFKAEERAGTSLPNWQRPEPVVYDCGGPDAATRPSVSHAAYHYGRDEPRCGSSLAEASWWVAEKKAGKPIPDYQHRAGNIYAEETALYCHYFLNGDRYYGISAFPNIRWDNGDYNPVLSEALATQLYVSEVLAWLPNRDEAEAVERLCIRSGNPAGRLLNITHNPWAGLPAPHYGPVKGKYR